MKEANHLESVPASLEQEPAIHDAFEVARQSRLTREEMDTLDKQAVFIHDSRNALRLSRMQGLEKGREEGMKLAKLEMARAFLTELPIEKISQATGLSIEEIEELKGEES